jgi:F-type H+-transporting ATPase subunit delta
MSWLDASRRAVADALNPSSEPAAEAAATSGSSVTAGDVVGGYTTAIVAGATAEDALDRVADELFRFARTIEGSPELGQRLGDEGADLAGRLALVDELLAGRAYPQTLAALAYVVQSGRGRQLVAIADAVVEQAATERGRSVAEVRSAVPLDDEQTARLASALSQASDRQVDVMVIVDPDVVGGLVVKMGDTVIDGSVARRLSELRLRLAGA